LSILTLLFRLHLFRQEISWHEIDVDTSVVGLQSSIAYLTKEATKFDLHLMLRERSDGGLHGDLIYSKDLFQDETMLRFSKHFTEMVKSVSSTSVNEIPIHSLPMLQGSEIVKIRDEWNESKPDRDFPPPNGLADTILKACQRFSHNVAIEMCGGKKYSCLDLFQQTSIVASGIWELSRSMQSTQQLRVAAIFDNGIEM
jgi:non-ribosomal peptide synthetase component F